MPTQVGQIPSTITVIEQGSFARATCTLCDWTGPGRRARAGAVSDADLHRLTGCTPAPDAVAQVRTSTESAPTLS